MTQELILACAPTKLREVAKKFVEPARAALIEDHTAQREKALHFMEISRNFEKSAEVQEDMTDDSILQELQSSFVWSPDASLTPSNTAASAAASAATAASAADATTTAVTPFVYRVDEEFQEEDHWERSRRGTSGFKYVSQDNTKAKPWRVKVCALVLLLCPN